MGLQLLMGLAGVAHPADEVGRESGAGRISHAKPPLQTNGTNELFFQ